MGDSFQRILAYLCLIFGLIIAVVLITIQSDKTIEDFVADETTDFIDECRTTGVIDPTNLRAYLTKVYKLGDFKVNLEHKTKTSFSQNGVSQSMTGYSSTGNEGIMSCIFTDSGDDNKYKMRNGDMIVATVTRESGGIGNRLLNFFVPHNETNEIVVQYSGLVGYSSAVSK